MRIGRYLLQDLLRNRIILATLFLFAFAGWGVFLIESQPQKALLILMQLTLLALPLITLVFTSVYYYNSADFVVLVLAQPIARSAVIRNMYFGLCASFSICYLLGVGIPLLLFNPSLGSCTLLIFGVLLISIFVALSLWISTICRDRVKGMGVTLITWAVFAFLYDGLLLYLMYQFGDYPIERLILFLTFLNPIDVARIAVIMQTDSSALMGLSGAVFTNFFTTSVGAIVSFGVLLVWSTIFYRLARRRFIRMDI